MIVSYLNTYSCFRFQIYHNIQQMATENEFKLHPCSQKLKCLIGDHIKIESGSIEFDDSSFLLFRGQTGQTDLHLINKQFTAISQNLRMKSVNSLSCCSYIKRKGYFIFIYTSNDKISVVKFDQNAIGYEVGKEIGKIEHKFEDKDDFKVLSKPFDFSGGMAILAYSQKDEFYLLSLIERGKTVELEVNKLQHDQSKSNKLWGWFTRQKLPHYQQVKIIPLYNYEIGGYRFLCLRDNTAAVLQILLKKDGQSVIKQIYQCNSLPNAIGTDSKLLSSISITDDFILLAYSIKQTVTFVKLKIVDDENSITMQKIKTKISSNSFKILECKQHLFITIKENNPLKFKCLRIESNLKELTQSIHAIEPLFETTNPIWLCGNKKELFLINSHKVFQIEQDINEYDLSQQMRKYMSYENWIDRTIGKKIEKLIHQKNYLKILPQLDIKEDKLTEEFKRLKKSIIDPGVEVKIIRSIVCSAIIKIVVSKQEYFTHFLEYLTHPTIQSELRTTNQEQLVSNALHHQNPEQIEILLKLIVKLQMYEYFNDILVDISKYSLKEEYRPIINQIFTKVCSDSIHSFKTNQKNRSIIQYKILVQFTFRSIDIDEKLFIEDFLYLANNWREEEATFVHNLVLNQKLIHLFMHLFIRCSKQIFTPEDIKQIGKSLVESERQIYLNEFFHRLREAYVNLEKGSPEKKSLMNKSAILVISLIQYQDQIYNILQRTFPGLNAYLCLNNPHKKEYEKQIIKIGNQCSNSSIAKYMLTLSIQKQFETAVKQDQLHLCRTKINNGDTEQVYTQRQTNLKGLRC